MSKLAALLLTWAAGLSPAAAREAPTFRFFQPVAVPGGTWEENYVHLPKTFSATGFYTDMATKQVGPGIYAFDINSSLWSDGAGKSRYLVLPKDSVIVYVNDSDEYRFPEGATLVKHFWMDTVKGDASSRVLLETRLLVHQDQVWHGFSYKWRKDQADADLVGGESGASLLDSFTVKDAGRPRKKKWLYPARLGNSGRGYGFTTCNSCHLNRKEGRRRGMLGFITPQLNLTVRGRNQILDLIDRGYLVLGRGAAFAPGAAHRWYALDDSTSPGSTLEKRARSYLASNCSHCHSPDGNASCAPIYSYHTPDAAMNFIDGASRGNWGVEVPAPNVAKWVYSGRPEYSTLFRRLSAADSEGYRPASKWDYPGNPVRRGLAAASSEGPGTAPLMKSSGWDGNGLLQMPPLATYEVDSAAIRVFYAWIRSLPAGNSSRKRVSGRHTVAGGKLFVVQDRLQLPGDLAEAGPVRMTDWRGRRIPLEAQSPGAYRLPAGLPGGVYFLRGGKLRLAFAYFPGS